MFLINFLKVTQVFNETRVLQKNRTINTLIQVKIVSFYSIITDTITNSENQHIKKSKIKDTAGTALAKRKS